MKISFTKRLLLPVIFFVMGTSAVFAQADTVLYNSLKFTQEGTAITSLSNKGWSLENCEEITDGQDIRIKVRESITTPELSSLNGNARITLYASSTDSEDILVIQNEKGDTIGKHSLKKAGTWYRLSPSLLRNGNKTSKLKFTTKASNPFIIANVLVLDIGDAIFYETFNNVKGNGGNDKIYAFSSFYDVNTEEPTANELKEFGDLDYSKNKVEYIIKTNKCIFFWDSAYEISGLLIDKAIDCKLSFWLAGETTDESDQFFNVKVNNQVIQNYLNSSIIDGKWGKYEIPLVHLSPNSTITFNGGYVFLDDVMITEVSDSLKEGDADNSTKLAGYANKTINLSLKRTLREGIWNTLCLPFEFTTTSISGANIEMERLQSVDKGVFHFEPATTIPAGEPFILKTDQTIVDPKFHAVTITATEPGTVTPATGYSFKGIYSPTALETDSTNIFLATDGLLYTPAEGKNTMNGLRAYMIVPSNSIQARMAHDPYGTSGIRQTLISSRPATIYNLCGQAMGTSLKQLPQGIYIVNGKKVYTK